MKNYSLNKHMSLSDREIIASGINKGLSKQEIADSIGKDSTTVAKEIKLHRYMSYRCHLPLECNNYKHCIYDRKCTTKCPDYVLFKCTHRDRSPGACNGCDNFSHCRFNKFIYKAVTANNDYRTTLIDSRLGVNLTTSEAKSIADILSPLLKQGQSPYQILKSHPELNISLNTIYNYIGQGVLENFGVANIDLRKKVRRKMSKKQANIYKKRTDKKYLQGRLYSDFCKYTEDNPDLFISEMDTVYNDVSNGPFMQTFTIRGTEFLFALLHKYRDTKSMALGINFLDEKLGPEIFNKYFNIILTDRGTEFSSPDLLEYRSDNTIRSRIFYCDPMRSNQKGALENKHIILRYILPKETDLTILGLKNQDDLNIVLSHINSLPVKSLNGKTPFQFIKFMYPDLYNAVVSFGLKEIPADKVILKPYLLKNK